MKPSDPGKGETPRRLRAAGDSRAAGMRLPAKGKFVTGIANVRRVGGEIALPLGRCQGLEP